jgi:hypothetical protein
VRILLRVIAVVAGATVLGTIRFILGVPGIANAIAYATTSAFGALTAIGWVISLIAGPIAAIQLWRLRQIGRRAGVLVFGYGFIYYVLGMAVFRDPDVAVWPILAAATTFAVPLAILVSDRARRACGGRAPARPRGA